MLSGLVFVRRKECALCEVFREVIWFLEKSEEKSPCGFGDLRAVTPNSRLAEFRMENAPLVFPETRSNKMMFWE